MLYFEPNFVDEALVLLDRFGAGARLLAGGTRLGFPLRGGRGDDVSALVNLKRIGDLQGCSVDAGGLRIGALTTAATLASHGDVIRHAPLLALAAGSLGARQLRTSATIGGNVCSGDPVSDLATALLACDARCEISTLAEGPSSLPLVELVRRATPLAQGELLSAFEVPLNGNARVSYRKMLRRQAFELAIVAVAVKAQLKGGQIEDARIALAGVGNAPLFAERASGLLRGQALDERLVAEAANAAADEDARPMDDDRASAAYRRELVRVLTRRALQDVGRPS